MSNEVEPVKRKSNRALTPKLRFPDFRDQWDEVQLSQLAHLIVDRVGTFSCIPYTVKSGFGLVSQEEKYGRMIAGNSLRNYIRIQKDDFAYNKSATKVYPEGYIARHLDEVEAAVPNSIFTCFRVESHKINPIFLEFQFVGNLHGRWLRKFIAKGARAHGSLNINDDDLMALPVPLSSPPEQRKIAECMSSLDSLIAAEERMLEAIKTYKKGLMQQLFPQPGEPKPRLRFLEFWDKGRWEEKTFETLYDFKPNNTYSREKLNYESGTVKNIHYGDIHTRFGTHFHIGAEEVPFVNAEVLPNELNPESLCRPGDVIFADASEDLSDVGKCIEIVNVGDELVLSGSHTILARPRSHSLVVGFGGYLFKSRSARAGIEKEAQGTKVIQISPKRLATIQVFLPSDKAEQQAITDCLSALDARITAQVAKLDSLKTHKRGLIQQLFPTPEEP